MVRASKGLSGSTICQKAIIALRRSGEHVAAATRRRRRILQAGFFFIVRFGIGEYNKYMLDFKRDDCKTLLWYREEIMMVFGVMIAKGTY